MKKILYFTIALLITTACDKIPADERRTVSDGLPDWQGQYVLLQDFTGVQCVNCPASTREIKRLKTIFDDKLIVVKLHPQTNFNVPIGALSDTNVDLRNAQAQEYFLYYGGDLPLPTSFVMQKNERLSKPDLYYGKVMGYYARQAVATIDLTAVLADNTINLNTDIVFTNNYRANGNIQLSLMILEDSLLVFQQTTPAEGTILRNYRQDNVLRDMATPLWGDQIAGNSVAKDSKFNRKRTIDLNPEWKPENLSVVAILFDNDTKEVIQCAKIKSSTRPEGDM
ncbi:MAG: Omp28-related outer membrane protein, partial [Bacteroidales bacterium]|jgi:hypothetical protein|nr:Omp28-related outer membrane protein [Bacteroidales bacterium]